MKYKKIAIAGFAASMLAGAGTGLVLNIPGGASAASSNGGATVSATAADDTGTGTDSGTDTSTDAAPPARGSFITDTLASLVTAGTITQEQSDAFVAAVEAQHAAAEAAETESGTRPERGAAVTAALAELVTAGTITQEQSDAITAAIAANRPQGGPGMGGDAGPGSHGPGGHGPGGHGGGGHGGFGGGQSLTTAATALGITEAELTTELAAGKTIADVATEKGVDVQTVIDALVAERTADITQRITDFVNGVKPTPPTDAAEAVPAQATRPLQAQLAEAIG